MAVRVLRRGKAHRHLLFHTWADTWRGRVLVVECAHCDHTEHWSDIDG